MSAAVRARVAIARAPAAGTEPSEPSGPSAGSAVRARVGIGRIPAAVPGGEDPPPPDGEEPPSGFDGTVTLASPTPGAAATVTRPQLTVAVETDLDEELTVEVQTATASSFTGAASVTATFEAVDGGAVLTPAPLAAGTWYWRARILDADGNPASDWTDPSSFTVTLLVFTELTVTWTVDAAAPRPIHLWHTVPDGPDAADTVTIYGQGFPPFGGLTYGGTTLAYTSWELVGAEFRNVEHDYRRIDRDAVTCEHYEITFTAPNPSGDGALLTVGY